MEKRTNTNRPQRRVPQRRSGAARVILGFCIVVMVMIVGIGCGFLTASMNTRSNLADDIRPPASSQIYDINGNEIANVHAAENRVPVKITQIMACQAAAICLTRRITSTPVPPTWRC